MNENDTTQPGAGASNEREEVGIKYVKANFFRVIHADGAWGGISPKGDIHIALYNERAAIPDISRLVVAPDGKVLEPETFEAASKLVREVEADVIVDLGTARALRAWLDNKIAALEQAIEQAKAENTSNDGEEISVNAK